jgi:hypothetical protein
MPVRFKCQDGEHKIEGIVVNPGGWFGRVWILQIAIANALNPYYAIEADSEQDAIDEFADSQYSHLIDVPEESTPKWIEDENHPDGGYEEENDFSYAGNDGHYVDLSNCHLNKAPATIRYFVEWSSKKDNLSTLIDEALLKDSLESQ